MDVDSGKLRRDQGHFKFRAAKSNVPELPHSTALMWLRSRRRQAKFDLRFSSTIHSGTRPGVAG